MPVTQTTRTVRFHEYGEPGDVLRLETVPVPEPGARRIRVAVHSCGLNPADWALCRGLFAGDLPRGIGIDVSGTVDAVGADVTGVAVGDLVFGTADWRGAPLAGASDRAIMDFWTPLPTGLGQTQAAALPMALETAYRHLNQLGLSAGHSILIHGAGSTVGFAAAQIAVIRGARVIATAGPSNAQRLRNLGVTVTSYGDGLAERVASVSGGPVDLVLDTAPVGGALPDLVRIAGGDPKRVMTISDFAAAAELGVRDSFHEAEFLPFDRPAVFAEFAQLAADGKFTVPVAATFPLDDWRSAMDISLSGQPRGKLMLLTDPEWSEQMPASTSRAVRLDSFGGPEVLNVREVPAPQAGPGEIRVRVTAAGLNPMDWIITADAGTGARFGLSLPTGFGTDYAGVVDQVGDGVNAFAPGDRVFGGALSRAVADFVVVDPAGGIAAGEAHHTPGGVDDRTAATLAVAGRTAAAALAVIDPGPGDTVLIGGAAGGVGVFAVQLARLAGARVIGTGSATSSDFLRELGAEPVEYGDGLADRIRALAPGGPTAAIDLYGTETVQAARELGVPDGRICTIAAQVAGVASVSGANAAPGTLEHVARLVGSGQLQVPIAATYPVEQIRAAVKLQAGRHVHGKVVIDL